MAQQSTIILWIAIAVASTTGVLWVKLRNARFSLEREHEKAKAIEGIAEASKQENLRLRKDVLELTHTLTATRSLLEESTRFFPWLLGAKTQLDDLLAARSEQWLQNKKHPARKAAEEVRLFREKCRNAEEQLHRLRYRTHYFEYLFPWLADLADEDLTELLRINEESTKTRSSDGEQDDPARRFLSDAEYGSMGSAARNQLALDRHLRSRRSKWEVGRDFERYVGYQMEQDGFAVNYFGALQGVEDLGRDLVARRDEETLIVQCKYWSRERTIHEKHIYQLYGTYCDYVIENNLRPDSHQGELFPERQALSGTKPVFVTTAQLSDKARRAANLLGIVVSEGCPTDWNYPRIKCNISKRTSERIYHLPFDQQYDKTRVEPELGEKYALSCREAENDGFRRAWRWRPEEGD